MKLPADSERSDLIKTLLIYYFPPSSGGAGVFTSTISQARQAEIDIKEAQKPKFEQTLSALSLQELSALVDQTLKHTKCIDALASVLERFKEQCHPANSPDAWPDHSEWAQLPIWSASEVVALSLNRNPDKIVKSEWRNSSRNRTWLEEQYTKRERLVSRAILSLILQKRIKPEAFLEWADSISLSVPRELRQAIPKSLPVQPEEKLATMAPPNRQELKTSERNSLLKLILGMALEQYDYNPIAQRSTATTQIQSDLAEHGITMSEDTVRKYLKEATDKFWERQPD